MREICAHVGQSIEHLFLEGFTCCLEVGECEFIETLFWKVVRAHQVEELVCYQRLAVQAIDVE